MINGNELLGDFIKNNWMVLLLIYWFAKSIFPNSKILSSLGESISNLFPIFKKDKQ